LIFIFYFLCWFLSAPEINCVNEDAELFSRHLLFLAWRSHLEDAQPSPFSEVRTNAAFMRVSWYLSRSLAKIRGAPLQNARKACNLQIAADWIFFGISLRICRSALLFSAEDDFHTSKIFAQKFPSILRNVSSKVFRLSPGVMQSATDRVCSFCTLHHGSTRHHDANA